MSDTKSEPPISQLKTAQALLIAARRKLRSQVNVLPEYGVALRVVCESLDYAATQIVYALNELETDASQLKPEG